MGILIIWTSWEGTVIHIWRWSNLVVTLALKFKVVLHHAYNSDLSIHVSICIKYKDVLNYSSGSISHTFGVLVSGCTHMHANCILECIRLLFMCMLIYQMMVAGNLILRQSSTNGYLVWSLKFFHLKVVDFIVEFEKKDIHIHVGCDVVFLLKFYNKINHLHKEKLQWPHQISICWTLSKNKITCNHHLIYQHTHE